MKRTDITSVLEIVQELRKRLDILIDLREECDRNCNMLAEQLHQAEMNQIQLVNESLNHYVKNEIHKCINGLDNLLAQIKDAGIGIDSCKEKFQFNFKTIDEALDELKCIYAEIEIICKELNAIEVDEYAHPSVFKIDMATFDIIREDKITNAKEKLSYRPYFASVRDIRSLFGEQIQHLEKLRKKIEKILAWIGNKYMTEVGIENYTKEMAELKDKMLSEYGEQEHAKFEKKLSELLKKEDEVLNKSFFEQLEQDGKDYEPNYEYGSDDFTDSIMIGSLNLSFSMPQTASKDKELIKESPYLSKYIGEGVVCSPMIINLKKKGNIFLDVPKSTLGEGTIAFIHQYIQEFLLVQPSCRLNLCLFDFNDQCKFNRYAPLKNINQNALFKGIIRSERDVDEIINEIERTMYDISDNKLSVNGVSNIFEYNDKSKENPQSMHLMVLLDFPEKYSLETISQIAKITANGADTGMYTLIVRNQSYVPEFGSRNNVYNSAMETILNNSVHLQENENGYMLDKTKSFVPLQTLPIDEFGTKVFEVLKFKAEKQKATSILMQEMFDMSDNTVKKPLEFSKLVEVPIGKNGGNIQSVKFSTTGDSAAHALVIGGTGSGKSNLLHALILGACYRYSPKELQIYLIDFKGGVEFKYYERNRLPHICLTGLTSEPEDGVAILTNIRTALRERENIFRRNSVEDIVAYNSLEGHELMPRMLVIIDEVQELFAHEKLSQQALTILGELFKKGRAFGISILWASQTVPKTVGGDFKDKVLSQIGNRICLKLNNADDAEAIGISASKVRQLNRPEKGLGIIFDGLDFVEFRVAYASDDKVQMDEERKSDKVYRKDYISKINNRWKADVEACTSLKPLFIVGDDAIPVAKEGANKYQLGVTLETQPKSNEDYALSVGQDYISGEPFHIAIPLKGSKENCWIAGKDMDVLRDIMGYTMLSVALENKTNSDMKEYVKSIYYFNGELITRNEDNLLNILPERLGDMVSKIDNAENFIETMRKLYIIRKERYLHSAENHAPIFVYIHKLQFLAELFTSSQTYSVSDDETKDLPPINASIGGFVNMNGAQAGFGMTASSNSARLTFKDIFKEVWTRGSDVGIHFVVTMNEPTAIQELKPEMRECVNKVVIAGVNNESVSQMTDNYLLRDKVPTKDGVAFYYKGNEISKFKAYRYEAEADAEWLDALLKKYM